MKNKPMKEVSQVISRMMLENPKLEKDLEPIRQKQLNIKKVKSK